jgi:hypothetical protein
MWASTCLQLTLSSVCSLVKCVAYGVSCVRISLLAIGYCGCSCSTVLKTLYCIVVLPHSKKKNLTTPHTHTHTHTHIHPHSYARECTCMQAHSSSKIRCFKLWHKLNTALHQHMQQPKESSFHNGIANARLPVYKCHHFTSASSVLE